MTNPKHDPKFIADSALNHDAVPEPQSALVPEYQSLFQAKDSLQEVIAFANNQFPTVDSNALYAVFMMYHNTLLNLLESNA